MRWVGAGEVGLTAALHLAWLPPSAPAPRHALWAPKPQTARVPLEKIRGFRAPFLLHNQEQRAMLHAAGFAWDSSITATWAAGSFQPDGQRQTWPWTLDYGVALVSGLFCPGWAGPRASECLMHDPVHECMRSPLKCSAALPALASQDCETGTGNCSTSERLPGFWEFPMWNIQVCTACLPRLWMPSTLGGRLHA